MPSLLVAHRRPGFYFGVLQEGEVQAGDTIVKVASGPQAMTVAEIDALLYLPGRPRHKLARAVRIPAMSAGWRGSFQALLDRVPDTRGDEGPNDADGVSPAWAGLRPLRVIGIDRESSSVISLHLALTGEQATTPARPGQFLTVRLQPDPETPPVLRSYSLLSLPDGDGYRISVKREAHGVASGFLHTQLRVGDTLEAAAPRGDFVLRPGRGPVVLVSAGIGATPVLAMLHALAAERSCRQVWWLHGVRNGASTACPLAASSATRSAWSAWASSPRTQLCPRGARPSRDPT